MQERYLPFCKQSSQKLCQCQQLQKPPERWDGSLSNRPGASLHEEHPLGTSVSPAGNAQRLEFQ